MAANNASQAFTTRPVTPSASESTDGPIFNVINKRLRALRKKNNRIIQMEEAVAQGKVLNKEQEETLRSKTVVLAQIDELEKLKQPLAVAVAEEHSLAVKKYMESEAEKEARVSADEGYVVEEVKEDQKEEVKEGDYESVIGVVGDVLKLVYFGTIFDVKQQSEFSSMMLTRTHERGCCLTYDYVTDDDVDVLGEKDLDFISQLGSFLTSMPMVRDSITGQAALDFGARPQALMKQCCYSAPPKLRLLSSCVTMENFLIAWLKENTTQSVILKSSSYVVLDNEAAPI